MKSPILVCIGFALIQGALVLPFVFLATSTSEPCTSGIHFTFYHLAIFVIPSTMTATFLYMLHLKQVKHRDDLCHRILGACDTLKFKVWESDINNFNQMMSFLFLDRAIGFRAAVPIMRSSAISPDFGLLLWELFHKHHPETILEAGSGVSTLICAYYLKTQKRGHVFSLEEDEKFAQITASWIEKHGLGEYATVIHAPTRKHTHKGTELIWYAKEGWEKLHDIDIFIIDGPSDKPEHGNLPRLPAFPLLRHLLSKRALIICDDADRDAEREMIRQWMEMDASLKKMDIPLEKGATYLFFDRSNS